ncbi:MAG: tautomerase family protein [Lachnospiraceae bacterium]|nr:tautomerase family protein [Lachnospiraceae bacterium]
MPHISVKMYPGRDEEAKKNLAIKLKETLMKELGTEEKYVSVSVEDVPQDEWKEVVLDKTPEDTLFVKANF